LLAGKEEKWQHTFKKNIFCRFSDAARLQKSRLQAAKVFGIGSIIGSFAGPLLAVMLMSVWKYKFSPRSIICGLIFGSIAG